LEPKGEAQLVADAATARALADHVAELSARENSLPQTLALTESPESRAAAEDIGRYLTTDGLLLVRKALIARVEAWLGPGVRPYREPLSTAARVFDRWRSAADARAGWRDRLLLGGLWAALVLRASLMPLARGVTFGRRAYAVGVPNKWGPPRPDALHHDLLAVDRRSFTSGEVVVLAIGGAFIDQYRALGHPVVRVRRAPVPAAVWISDVLPRVAVLAWRRGLAGARTASGWLASFAAWDITWRSLDWEAVAGATRIRVITDVEEQNPEHAVKTAVFGRRGGRTLRMPHTQPDTPGNHTAFWMYHTVAVSNSYVSREYGKSWWSGSAIEPVGLIFNSDVPSEGSVAAQRLSEIAARGPILSIFTGSEVGVQPLIHKAVIQVAARALLENPWLQVVIKPKPSHASFLDRSPVGELLAPFVAAGRVTVFRPSDVWCSAQAILRRSAVCLTYGGSVVTEALALGTPVVVYPVVPAHKTPWVDAFRGSVIVDSEEGAVALLTDILTGRARKIDRDLVRDHCDAFLDDQALGRLTALVERLAQ
jgi:UDP-N-acetylglucosamine:LPS N-acetylglucosamine transferase